jgi:dTDP-4-amino-4,6-dideoxygalactose transaminase
MAKKDLALFGGKKAVQTDPGDIFRWPIITKEDEDAALEVLRAGKMSGLDVTEQFEREFAEWHGTKYALAHNTGTAALHSAMFACGVGAGDEIICQSLTYWASCLPAFSLGASIVFAEVNDTLTLEPKDIEKRISKRTKAIIAVHYCGYPTDMDPIMAVAKKHGIKVIEDVSHAHGALYKGRIVGTIGHVGAMSVMSGKALPVGEGGFLVTNDQEIYERSVAFGHYERTTKSLTLPELKKFAGLPQGGYKYRMHQLSSAVGRVQLKHYRKRMEEILKAMNYFWDLLEGVPGIKPHRPAKGSGSTMGGWYAPHGIYVPEQVGGLPVQKFCEAVRAEGVSTGPGANVLLHLHPVMNECDVYHQGKPTRVANVKKDIRQPKGSLPVSETMPTRCYGIPWFKHYRPQIIKEHALAFRKAAENADALR